MSGPAPVRDWATDFDHRDPRFTVFSARKSKDLKIAWY